MKQGKTLTDLAAEIERQSKTKRDFVADTRKLHVHAKENAGIVLRGIGMDEYHLQPTAHGQMAASLSIPTAYYQRMLAEQPDLLARNVNVWLEAQPAKKLVRTLDGGVRAFLSDSYRPLDNLDLAQAVLPKLASLKADVVSCEITDNRMYLKAVTDRVRDEVKAGDMVQAGLVVSNSEVGQGSLRVEAMDYRLVCLNGMIREAAIRKAHLGRRSRGGDAIEDAREFFRDETRRAGDRAFFLEVQDTVGSMFDQQLFTARILQYRAAGGRQIAADADLPGVVEVVGKRFSLTEAEQSGVLQHLIRGGDLSAWGMANAVTRTAQDVGDYDRATTLEALGGDIVMLPADQWRAMVA